MAFTRSSFCGESSCVEVDLYGHAGSVLVRSTRERLWDTTLRFTADEWTTFVAGVKAGEFDLP